MRLLLLDNYDSFTYNLADYIYRADPDVSVSVIRNNKLTVQEACGFDAIVLSPGPGLPAEAGIMADLLLANGGSKPVLGICLGMQAIAQQYGGELFNLPEVYHGLSRAVHITDATDHIYQGIPGTFQAGRYHSWAVKANKLPASLVASAVDDDGVLMSLYHREFPVHGLQYHPESIMTTVGVSIIANFLRRCRNWDQKRQLIGK